MRVDVDPQTYQHASQPLVDAGKAVTRIMSALSDGLSSSSAMAGSDSGGQSFASSYDTAAGSAARAGSGLAGALGTMSNLV